MKLIVMVGVQTVVWTLILTIILRRKRRGRPQSLALFTFNKEDDRNKQVENFFKYANRFGTVTVVLVAAGMITLLIPFVFVSLFDTNAAIPFVAVSFGLSALIIGGVFATVLLATSSRIIEEPGLEMTVEQDSSVRKGRLFGKAALSLEGATFVLLIAVTSLRYR